MAPDYRNSAPSTLDWVLEHFSVTPVLNEGEKCGGWFPEPSPSVLGSEWTLAQRLMDVLLPSGQFLLSLSIIVSALLSLLIEPMAAGKVAFFRTGKGFRLMPSLCFL